MEELRIAMRKSGLWNIQDWGDPKADPSDRPAEQKDWRGWPEPSPGWFMDAMLRLDASRN